MITRDDGTIERFLEKPTWGEVFSDTINTGIYVLEPEVFDFIPDGEVVDFSGDVFPRVLDERPASCTATSLDGYWEDVGTLEAYRTRARGRPRRPGRDRRSPGFQLGDGVWIGEDVDVSTRRRASTGPVLIGDNCRIEAGAVLRPVHRARHRRRREGRRVPRAHASCTTTSTSGRGARCAAR